MVLSSSGAIDDIEIADDQQVISSAAEEANDEERDIRTTVCFSQLLNFRISFQCLLVVWVHGRDFAKSILCSNEAI